MRNKTFSFLRLLIVLLTLGVQLSCNSPNQESKSNNPTSIVPDASLNSVVQSLNQSLSPQYQLSSADIQLLQSGAELSQEEIQELVLLLNR